MGPCLSTGSGGATFVENVDGTEEDFHRQYFEDRILGEGEFGVVKLVHDMQAKHDDPNDHREPLACKILRKGVVFKDNTIYAPMKPQILKRECDILRTLAGKHFCLKLCSVFESSRLIYILTEYCSGGSMSKYVVSVHGEEALRSEDVSRIVFQLLDAVNHCANHRIIHRDIKPDNIMFRYPTPGAELRLIDFGSGTVDAPPDAGTGDSDVHVHTTFAGSGFYISPELFQKQYTSKTDVWSAGVVLYVLVAGYPADELQKAFNLLQKPKRDLRKLPNLPHNLPDSFYDLLKGLLVYRQEDRNSAGSFLMHEFVQFHKHMMDDDDDVILSVEEIAAEAAGIKLSSLSNDARNNDSTSQRKRLGRSASVQLSGSVARHALFLGYQKFERALTTLLAAILTKPELDRLLKIIAEKSEPDEKVEVDNSGTIVVANGKRLEIVPIGQLTSVLKDLNHERVPYCSNILSIEVTKADADLCGPLRGFWSFPAFQPS